MRLMHYRAEPIEFDPNRTYAQQAKRGSFTKPVGFWVSVQGEQDWPAWCRSKEFRLDSFTYAYEVRLATDANIRMITTAAELDVFHREFAAPTPFELRHNYGEDEWGMDWKSVAQRYAGVIIGPYQWERRWRDWYYGWDCASGCIWDLAAIESVTAVSGVAA